MPELAPAPEVQDIPPAYAHQHETSLRMMVKPRCIVLNDPGTGKTRSVLDAFVALQNVCIVRRLLVFAPLTILRPAWVNDVQKFTPHLNVGIAHGPRKKEILADRYHDIVLVNHDGVKWVKNEIQEGDFDWLVIDESTAYKNANSQRSKAMRSIAQLFKRRTIMTGTFFGQSVLETWHQVLIVDDGHRLGTNIFGFRHNVCIPLPSGPRGEYTTWQDKPEAADVVSTALNDISIRFTLEECLDIPPNNLVTVYTEMSASLRRKYTALLRDLRLEADNGEIIDAFTAQTRANKLLQLVSGAVYGEDGALRVHNERYALVAELIEERAHSVTVCLWQHQFEALGEILTNRGITYAIINGDIPERERGEIVERFQAGHYQTLLIHPQAAGHGLTLTRATATIWCSPTGRGEWWHQVRHRIYRATQTQTTETIRVAMRDTSEEALYDILDDRLERAGDLQNIFALLTRG